MLTSYVVLKKKNSNDTNTHLIYKQGTIKQDSPFIILTLLNNLIVLADSVLWLDKGESFSMFSPDISFNFLVSKQPKCLFAFSSDREE